MNEKIKIGMTPACSVCGGEYPLNMANDGSDIPIMLGFVVKDGSVKNICRYCMIDTALREEREE